MQRLLGVAALVATVVLPLPARATPASRPPHYRLVDLGTFGGPNADVIGPDRQITSTGAALGFADTAVVDSDAPNDGASTGDGYVHHGFNYRRGRLTDLGALPGENNSAVFEVNRHGLGVGASETGAFDPRVGVPATHPVLFVRGQVIDIGTLPGGTEGFAVAVNDRGTVVGLSNDAHAGPAFPDFFDWHGQIRSFVREHGRMRDLGTLGGPGAVVDTLNARGQVNGDSYVDATVDPATGHPTVHPFVWRAGRMRDLGSLGGSTTASRWMNERGQVAGRATLPGEHVTHAFFWDGRRLRDLGTLGGPFGSAEHVNDRGVVVGIASTATEPDVVHTFRWRDGRTTDLSPGEDVCTFPEWINNAGEVVGGRCGNGGALLWRHDREYDLNTLVGTTDATLTNATFVDERGVVLAVGTLPNGNQHVFRLSPESDR